MYAHVSHTCQLQLVFFELSSLEVIHGKDQSVGRPMSFLSLGGPKYFYLLDIAKTQEDLRISGFLLVTIVAVSLSLI